MQFDQDKFEARALEIESIIRAEIDACAKINMYPRLKDLAYAIAEHELGVGPAHRKGTTLTELTESNIP